VLSQAQGMPLWRDI